MQEKSLAKGMDSFPVEISEWIFNEDLSNLFELANWPYFNFQLRKVNKNEYILNDLIFKALQKFNRPSLRRAS